MSDKIKCYKARINIYGTVIYSLLSFAISLSFVLFAIIYTRRLVDLIIVLFSFWAFCTFMILVLHLIDFHRRRICIYKDGFEIFDELQKKRVLLNWSDSISVKYSDNLTEKFLVLSTSDPEKKINIPFPINERNSLKAAIIKYAGENHPLAQVISTITT